MEALYLLIPLSVVLVLIAIWIFLKMSDGGQFDDMVGPAMRVLQDDDRPNAAASSNDFRNETKPGNTNRN